MKKCRICGENKTLDDFYTLTRNRDNKDTRCKPCVRKKQKGLYEETKDLVKLRERNIKRRYGLEVQEYDAMLLSGCVVCGKMEDLQIDHDHDCCPGQDRTCGKCIRGVLCGRHNRADGAFKSVEEIEKYLEYRRKYLVR